MNSTTGVATRHLARAVVALRSVRDQTMVLWPGRLNLHRTTNLTKSSTSDKFLKKWNELDPKWTKKCQENVHAKVAKHSTIFLDKIEVKFNFTNTAFFVTKHSLASCALE